MLHIDYTDQKELVILAEDIRYHAPADVQEKVLNEVMLTGLMVDPRLGPKIMQKILGRRRFFSMVLAGTKKQMGLAHLWEQMIQYMVNGRDQYDPKSAGGWGASELSTFTGILERHGYEPSPLLVNYQAGEND